MTDDPRQAPPKDSPKRGWPMWLRLLLAAIVLSFVWSPFLAMLIRLSSVNPSLAPDAPPPSPPGSPPGSLSPTAPQAPRGGGPAPSP